MTKQQTKKQRIATLERKLCEALAGQAHTYAFAEMGIEDANTSRMLGSGVVLTITALGGAELCRPVLIRDGLSEESIAALKSDLRRSYEVAIEMKPKGTLK